MRLQRHPTHHDGYRPSRVLAAVIAAVAGVFVFMAALALSSEPGTVSRLIRRMLLVASGAAFVLGTLFAAVLELVHRFDRCPECRRVIFRTRIDGFGSYYPCWRCGIRWTCDCNNG